MGERESQTPVTPVPAASIMLLRDAADGLEILMMERHGAMGFAAGALVFPGGKVDASDSAPALAGRVRASQKDEPEAALLPFRLAALRELFEEAGVLLAVDASGQMIDPARAAALAAEQRENILRNPAGFADLLEAEDLYLAVEDLVYYAHWITPEPVPKRFDTYFFAARAPAGQQAVSDGQEAVQMGWTAPKAVLELGASGTKMVMFPTQLNLQRLMPSGTVEAALAAASKARVVTVMPKPIIEDGEVFLTIPPDAGYGDIKVRREDVPEVAGRNPGLAGKPQKP